MIGAANLATALQAQSQRGDLLDVATKKLQEIANGNLNKEAAKQVSKEFETLFITQMLEHMFKQSEEENPLSGQAGGDDIYQSMMVQEYGKAITSSGGIGIASFVQRELLKTQEV